MSFSFHLACYMSDKVAFVNSVYSRYRAQTSNVNVISPAFKRLLLAESEFKFLKVRPSSYCCISVRRSKHILLVIKNDLLQRDLAVVIDSIWTSTGS